MNAAVGICFLVVFLVLNFLFLKIFVKKSTNLSEKLLIIGSAQRWITLYGENYFLTSLGIASYFICLLLPLGLIFQANSLSLVKTILINIVSLLITSFFTFTVKNRMR